MRNEIALFKVSKEEKETLRDCASILNISLSEYIRRCCLVPIDVEKRDLFNEINNKAMRIYDEWGYLLDRLAKLVKNEKHIL